MIKLYTVILEYQNPQMTLETIESLKAAAVPKNVSHKIVVIDNSPVPDGTLKKALRRYRNIKLITTYKNTGFAAGNNRGIKYGLKHNADYFLLLNNDVIVDKKFLKPLLTAGAGLAVPKIYFAKGYEYHHDRYKPKDRGKVIWYAGGGFDWNNVQGRHYGIDEVDKGQFDESKLVDFANFCCVLISKDVFAKIGLLDTKFFLYWEDSDFSHRARLHGFKQVYVPQSVIWHKSSGSSGSGSRLHDYYLTRNRLIFGFRYASLRTKLALFRQSLKQLFFGRPGERKGVFDYYCRRFGKESV